MFWIHVILKVNGAKIDMYYVYVKPTKKASIFCEAT